MCLVETRGITAYRQQLPLNMQIYVIINLNCIILLFVSRF